MYTVSKAAKMAKVSVRTLHHYDEIGLLSPADRSASGYRLYSAEDMVRLEQILFFKEMGFSLERICELMDDPSFDRNEALRLQRRYLENKMQDHQRKIAAIDKVIGGKEKESTMKLTSEEIQELFGDFDPREYEDEVQQRWGATDGYKQSAERTSKYTKSDWEQINVEAAANNERLADLFARGVAFDDPEMVAAVHAHHQHICTWFYDCPLEVYSGLADMYIQDHRFTENLDKVAPGFAQNLHDAIKAYVKSR